MLERFLLFLQTELNEPAMYGVWHLSWLAAAAIVSAALYRAGKSRSEKQLKTVLLVFGLVALTTETLKQVSWSYCVDAETGIAGWDYQWYAFPFQLCSTPIYASLLCAFLKKGRLRDSVMAYMAFITMLGSVSTMAMPEGCLTGNVFVNIHTSWLHFGSFVVSLYLLTSGHVKGERAFLMGAYQVFLVCVALAMGMNLAAYHAGFLGEESFNMFYISPYFECELPVFVDIQQRAPYAVFLLSYLVAIALGACIVCGITRLCSTKKHTIK